MDMMESFTASTALMGGFSFLATVFAMMVVASKSAVTSAFSLVMVIFNVAAIFAIQGAHFVAAVQILVYAGAIVVLFIFVIMLLNIDIVQADKKKNKLMLSLAGIGTGALFFNLFYALSKGGTSFNKGIFSQLYQESSGGNFQLLSELLFSRYVFTFELVGMLLLTAIVGAMVLAKKKVD